MVGKECRGGEHLKGKAENANRGGYISMTVFDKRVHDQIKTGQPKRGRKRRYKESMTMSPAKKSSV